MDKISIVLVEYLNTIPFMDAFSKVESNILDITPAIPAKCAESFFHGNADIALVPVASWIAHGAKEKVITDFCIGCVGEVGTVLLCSKVDLQEVEYIYLDTHSRTSVQLLKVLCKKYWKIEPKFIQADVTDLKLADGEAKLMIGDKVFTDRQEYHNVYDLGLEWERFTSLPFAFAIWLAKDHVDQSIIDKLNKLFHSSLDDMKAIIDRYDYQFPSVDLKLYFTDHISYPLTEAKHKAISRFQHEIHNLAAIEHSTSFIEH